MNLKGLGIRQRRIVETVKDAYASDEDGCYLDIKSGRRAILQAQMNSLVRRGILADMKQEGCICVCLTPEAYTYFFGSNESCA